MNKWLIGCLICLTVTQMGVSAALAEDGGGSITEEYATARVVEVIESGETPVEGGTQPYQKLRLKILSGPEKGVEIVLDHGTVIGIYENQVVSRGDRVVIVRNTTASEGEYYITDRYRLPSLGWLAAIFLALVIYLGRWKGVASIAGLALSILILAAFVIPRVLAGANPLLTSVIGAAAIIFLSLYLAHGFNKRTSISVVSIVLTLGLATVVSWLTVGAAHLVGMGSEEALYLQLGGMGEINLQGLLLGGILIGALGVLDDITTSQAAAVEELSEANLNLTVAELYRRGINIGTEHIASLVNTLALAYVGASFPLLLLFGSTLAQPAWVIINSERVAEEIVRTLIGSLALVAAVPIVTYLAAYLFANDPRRGTKHGRLRTGHHH